MTQRTNAKRASKKSRKGTRNHRRRRRKNETPLWIWLFGIGIILVVMVLLIPTEKPIPMATGEIYTQGQEAYNATCAACHGLNGEGGNGAAILNGSPQSHSWHHRDPQLREVVLNGIPGTGMPAHEEHLTEEQVDAVLAYIKTWWSAEQRAMQSTGQHPMGGAR